MCPNFENPIQDANGHVTRFYYYKEAFYEAVLQRELNKDLYNSGHLKQRAKFEALNLLGFIYALGSKIDAVVRADAINYLQSVIDHVPLEFTDTMGESFKSLSRTISEHTGDINLSAKVTSLGKFLSALPIMFPCKLTTAIPP